MFNNEQERWREMAGERKADLGFRGWQTVRSDKCGKVNNMWEGTTGIRFCLQILLVPSGRMSSFLLLQVMDLSRGSFISCFQEEKGESAFTAPAVLSSLNSK